MDDNNELLLNQFKNLPPGLQQAITQSGWKEKLERLAQQHNLTPNQTAALVNETALVLFGLEDQADYAVNLEQIVGAKAKGIAGAAEKDIWYDLADYLIELASRRDATEEAAEEEFGKLPLDIQEILAAAETEKVIQAIGAKHRLHIDQTGTLDEEVERVLFGVSPTAGLVNRLEKRLGVEGSIAEAIIRDLDEEIFAKIRNSLMELTVNRGGNLPTQEEILREIENPTPLIPTAARQTPAATPAANGASSAVGGTSTVFEQKMGGVFPQTPPAAAEPKIKDPYLEPVE